jgi:hypothetical protein
MDLSETLDAARAEIAKKGEFLMSVIGSRQKSAMKSQALKDTPC